MGVTRCEVWSGRSLLVLGAGYVGGAVVRDALARGARVTALTRNADRAAALRVAGAAVVEADLADDTWHAAAGGDFDFVLNCVSAGGGGAAGYRHSYVEGMRSVGRWLATRARAGTIVYTSSTGVYPQGGGAAVDETAPTGGSETGELLRAAEAELARAAGAAGWRWFVLRLAGIYGPGRHGILDALRGGATRLPGDPTHRLNLIHRDDVVGAVRACCGAAPTEGGGIFNLSDGAPAERAVVARWLAERLGVAAPEYEPAAGPATGRRRAPDRIIVAELLRRRLGWAPQYPDYQAGYGPILRGVAAV